MPDTEWGWLRTDKGTMVAVWVGGTLEESYARVSRHGGTWILYSANPVSEYHRIMREVASGAR